MEAEVVEGVMGTDLNELLKLTGAVLSVGGFWAAITIVSVRTILNRAIEHIEDRIASVSESILDHRRRLDQQEARLHELDIAILHARENVKREVQGEYVTSIEFSSIKQWMQEIRSDIHDLREALREHERNYPRRGAE